MAKKEFKEYVNKVFDKEENYEKIIRKEKERKDMKVTLKKIINIAAIFVIILATGAMSTAIYAKIQWNIQFKDFNNKQFVEIKGKVEEAKEDGYAEVLNTDYIKQDGVSIKVDSLLITDDCFSADIDFKFDEEVKVEPKRLEYSFAIYDENKNIYGIYPRATGKRDYYTPFIYKELGVKYNKNNIYTVGLSDSIGIGTRKINEKEKELVSRMDLSTGKSSFPKSKKIFIRIENIGYTMYNFQEGEIAESEDFTISDSKWIFEIDVPEKIYNRETYKLKLEHDIPNFKVEDIRLTETGLTINFQNKEYTDFIMAGKNMDSKEFQEKKSQKLYFIDEKENKYKILEEGSDSTPGIWKMKIEASKKDFKNKIYVVINIDGKEYKEKLIRVN